MKININSIRKLLNHYLKNRLSVTKGEPVFTRIPESESIELIAYYDEFKEYYPDCEMETKEWFVKNVQKDWVILDCGANIGYYTILFARLAYEGHVYAFEPTVTYEMLMKNLTYHKLINVSPIKQAVGDKTGHVEDFIFRIWGKQAETREYSFTTIDDFIHASNLKRVDCIKIDVDSYDFEVLRGAKETLINFDPFVIVELNHALDKRNQSVTQAFEWLMEINYKSIFALDYDNFLLKRQFINSREERNWPSIEILFNPQKSNAK